MSVTKWSEVTDATLRVRGARRIGRAGVARARVKGARTFAACGVWRPRERDSDFWKITCSTHSNTLIRARSITLFRVVPFRCMFLLRLASPRGVSDRIVSRRVASRQVPRNVLSRSIIRQDRLGF